MSECARTILRGHMAKTWQDRITETLTFIEGLAGGANLGFGSAIAQKIRLTHVGNHLQAV